MSSPHVYRATPRLAAVGGVCAVLAIAVLSCRLPTRPPGTAEFRVAASPTPTVAPAWASTPTPAPPGETPTVTPTGTVTPTVTLGPPTFTTSVNANCRSGPGLVYDVVRVVMAGTSEPIVGRDAASTWWVIQGGARCWVSSITGTTSGDLSGVPVLPAPPTPTPIHTATPTITLTPTLAFGWRPPLTIIPPPIPQVSSASITVSSTTCVMPCVLTFSGTITATGPLTANYEWQSKFGSGSWSTIAVPVEPLIFSGPGTLNVPDFPKDIFGLAGTRTYRLHVTSPNSVYSNEVEVLCRHP